MSTIHGRRGLPSRRGRQAGFSLVELLVSLVIMAEILIGLLILFDSSNKLARTQTQVAELQQSLRVGQAEVVRYARMAGIGGLPITRLNLPGLDRGLPADEPDGPGNYSLLGAFPRSGHAISVLNDVPHVTIVEAANPGTATPGSDFVVPGSDVLIVRGVFSTPLFYFDPPIQLDALDDKDVIIPDRVRPYGEEWEDYPQDIESLGTVLTEALGAGRQMALILRDTLNPNAYAIMELDMDTDVGDLLPAAAVCAGLNPPPPGGADPADCIGFKLALDTTAEPGISYGKLTSGTNLQATDGTGMVITLPAGSDTPADDPYSIKLPTNIGSIGLLEEYRFFVRVEHEVPGDASTRLTPVLSRARFLPGTDVQIDRVDVADNVIDLQIAIGVDDNGDGVVTEDADGDSDEVLYNHPNDTTSSVSPYGYRPPTTAETWYDPALEFFFLRINTLVQARLPSRDQVAPSLAMIEDNNRGLLFTIGSENYQFNTERLYQRRWLQTVVELRNLL